MIKAGIIGSTGYAGQQLVWLLRSHKNVEIVLYLLIIMQAFLSQMCIPIMLNFFIKTASIFLLPRSNFPLSMCCSLHCPRKIFCFSTKAIQSGVKVIDLGADFRLRTARLINSGIKSIIRALIS